MKAKRLLASFLAASLTFSMSATAFAADAKAGSEGTKDEYKFSKDTVFFNVKGDVRDLYDVNADTGLKKKIGTFKGATEYFVSKDTDFGRFTRWLDFESGEYHLADDTKLIPNKKAIWAAQFKAPAGKTNKQTVVDGTEVQKAIDAANSAAEVVLGDAMYVVEAKSADKMSVAAEGSKESIKLNADVQETLKKVGKDVVLSTGIASLTVSTSDLVDSFNAEVAKVNANIAGLTETVQYNLTVNDGKPHNFSKAVEVSVPVVLPEAKSKAYVYFLDDKGALKSRLADANVDYNAKNGTVTFKTTHFSSYVIATELKSDVPVEGGDNSGNSSSGGSSSSSSKPSVTVNGEGGKVNVDNKGNVAIVPSTGYRVKDVTVNGKSVGAVESLTGLKSTDKVVVTFEKIEDVAPVDPSNPFADVASGAWYYDAVRFAYENKLFSGITSTKFGPNQSMTRAMLVTVLYRHSGSAETGTASFADVAANAYYANAVAWAEKNGIVTGIDKNTFAPNKNVTREQISAILNRYAKFSGKTLAAGELNFADAAQIAEYAKADVAAMQAAGIVTGRGNNVFAPKASATRAEVATMIMRYIENVK